MRNRGEEEVFNTLITRDSFTHKKTLMCQLACLNITETSLTKKALEREKKSMSQKVTLGCRQFCSLVGEQVIHLQRRLSRLYFASLNLCSSNRNSTR